MLEQKRISSKINYDVLKDLNVKPGSSPARKVETPKKEPIATKLTGRNRTPARSSLSLSTPLSTLGKRWERCMFYTYQSVSIRRLYPDFCGIEQLLYFGFEEAEIDKSV